MLLNDFNDYREYLVAHIASLPQKGKGEITKIAKHLGMSTSLLSQILHKKRNFSIEQACLIGEYLNFTNSETDYFLLLVQLERAGTKKLKQILNRQIQEARAKTSGGKKQSDEFYVIPDKDKAQFYSNWYYSGIRLLTELPENQNTESISKRLNLPRELVEQVLDFLLNTGLCELKNGKVSMGPARTHLDTDLATRTRHHTNWRIKGLERLPIHSPPEFYFTAPMCISHADGQIIREMLLEFVAKINKVIIPSPAEKLSCLTIDWFDF